MTTWLVDSHLHFYPCYNLDKWLDSIFENFNYYINKKIINDASIQFVCFLTERLSENYFEHLKVKNFHGKYKIELNTANYESIRIISPTNQAVTIYPGQQIVANEGIEVLALGKKVFTTKPNLTASQILSQIKGCHAISVLPWSFGKWHGRRLDVVKDCIATHKNNLYIGDIFGRNAIFGSNFDKIKNEFNIKVLTGSDPLPIKNEEKYVANKICVISDQSQLQFDQVIHRLLNQDFSNIELDSLEVNNPSTFLILYRQIRLRINCRVLSND